jgi:hypothetical protein
MSAITESHEYELEKLARLTHIKRQVAAGELSQLEALAQLQRLNLPGVQVVVAASDADLIASIGAPPEPKRHLGSRPLTPEEQERVRQGLYLEEW